MNKTLSPFNLERIRNEALLHRVSSLWSPTCRKPVVFASEAVNGLWWAGMRAKKEKQQLKNMQNVHILRLLQIDRFYWGNEAEWLQPEYHSSDLVTRWFQAGFQEKGNKCSDIWLNYHVFIGSASSKRSTVTDRWLQNHISLLFNAGRFDWTCSFFPDQQGEALKKKSLLTCSLAQSVYFVTMAPIKRNTLTRGVR